MSGFLWKAPVRNVRRAFKEVNAFEWEAGISHSAFGRGIRKVIRDRFQAGIRVEEGQEPRGEHFRGEFLR